MLTGAASTFFSDESSGQGKAGALWETAFPLLHPLPSPRSTPSFEVSPRAVFRLRTAFRKGRASRFLPASPSRGSHGPRALTQRASFCRAALAPYAFFESFVSGGSALGSHQRLRNFRPWMDIGTRISRPAWRGEGRQERLRSRTLGRQEANARSSPARQAARVSTCPGLRFPFAQRSPTRQAACAQRSTPAPFPASRVML